LPYIAPALSRPSVVSSDTITQNPIVAPESSAISAKIHLAIVVLLAILALVLAIYLVAR
jgi:hypothetical protein